MADQEKTTYTRQEGRYIAGTRGAEAGNTAKFDAQEDARRRQQYDSEMGWAGIGNAGKKPKGPAYEEGYQAWKKKKFPAPTPTPKAKVSSEEAADALEKGGGE